MYLALDQDEREIVAAVAGFLDDAFPLVRLHEKRPDAERLGEFAELGWLGLAAPPEVGGSGLGIVEEMLFFLELGRVAGPVSVLAQVLAVSCARDDAELQGALGAAQDAVSLLVELGDGRLRVVGNGAARYALELSPDAANLYELDMDALEEVVCLDRSASMHVGADSALRPVVGVEGAALWRRAQVDVSAMLLGVAGCALDMIVDYAGQRETFGRPIGAYQAVRHPCADMAVRIEVARSQLYYAATALRDGQEDAGMQVDAAQLLCVRAAKANTDANIQLHGGIGVTDEFNAHLLLKRANLLWRLLGSGRQCERSLLQVETTAGGDTWT